MIFQALRAYNISRRPGLPETNKIEDYHMYFEEKDQFFTMLTSSWGNSSRFGQ